eukprot:symbB.v1.2.008158.t1/scaffold510.1/size193565/8
MLETVLTRIILRYAQQFRAAHRRVGTSPWYRCQWHGLAAYTWLRAGVARGGSMECYPITIFAYRGGRC